MCGGGTGFKVSRTMIRAVRAQVAALDPNLAVFNIESMQEHVNKSLLIPKLSAVLRSAHYGGCVYGEGRFLRGRQTAAVVREASRDSINSPGTGRVFKLNPHSPPAPSARRNRARDHVCFIARVIRRERERVRSEKSNLRLSRPMPWLNEHYVKVLRGEQTDTHTEPV